MMPKRYAWLLVILLAGAALRLAAIDQIPPGLTHDEADHGQDAWGVVQGVRPIYFTVGYGREPLYDYATAGLLTFLGPTYLGGRLTAVFFSLILIAAMAAWSCLAFNRRVALLTAAGLAFSFWPVMTARQGLRSITLPALFTLALYLFWRGLEAPRRERASLKKRPTGYFVAAGLLLGLTFYTYIPARVLWLVFPTLLLFLALIDRPALQRLWPGTAVMLLLAALIAWPLLTYLADNPAAEVRLDQLSEPLTAVREGNWQPLLTNSTAGLMTLTFKGDSQWRYNIPGRPFLGPLFGLLFYGGLLLAVWRAVGRRSQRAAADRAAPALALIWAVAGLSPILVTGPELSTTQAIGLQPVLFLFPALALDELARRLPVRRRQRQVLLLLLFAGLLGQTARDYFFVWANAPEVRVQYESTLVTAIDYLNEHGQTAAAISTTTPGQFHSPAVALLTLDNPDVTLRWFNGLHSLLLPQTETGTVLFTGFAPLNDALVGYFDGRLQTTLPLRADDLDRPVTVYAVDGPALLARHRAAFDHQVETLPGLVSAVDVGQALTFLGYDLQTPAVAAGGELRLATLWQIRQPLAGAVLFSQLLDDEGQVVAQLDRLDVPGESWIAGDAFIQLHQFWLPADLPPGSYRLIVGLYTRPDLIRQPLFVDGAPLGDFMQLRSVEVTP